MKRLTSVIVVVLIMSGPAVGIDRSELTRAQPGGHLVLDLSDDLSVDATVTQRTERSRERFTLSGTIPGLSGGSFILAVNRDAVAGYVNAGILGSYRLRLRGVGVSTAERIDTAPDFVCNVDGEAGLNLAEAQANPAAVAGACDDGSIIDVLVVFTRAARNAAGGIAAVEAEIDLLVAYNNVAYQDSQIATQWNLVYTRQLGPGEDPSLGQLTDPNDGIVDGVHDLRDAYGADQVALVDAGSGGLANGLFNLSPGSAAMAFCWNGLGSSPFVLSHEIGHNMGCCHAIGDGGGCTGKGLLFVFSNGYRFFGNSGTQWRTIMAYNPGSQIQYFSNPDLLFDGQPLGIPAGEPQAADNVQTINLSAFAVSNWRCNDGICEALDLPSNAPDCNGNGIPDGCDLALGTILDCGCPWDCGDGDGEVGIVDFLALLSQWGAPSPCDFDGGGDVGITDMLELLANWGPCP